MLMPSALPCDSSQTAPMTRLQSALFTSPPPSPPQVSTQTAIGSLFTTCRSLQSLLASPPPLSDPGVGPEPITPPTSSHAQLPTPPMTHAPPPPLKLRLRSRKTDGATPGGADHAPARKRIVKRSAAVAPARGLNKRRRAVDDDMGRNSHNHGGYDSNDDMEEQPQQSQLQHELENPFYILQQQQQDQENEPQDEVPHTPKRSRIAPEVLPLGLERTDYHELHADGGDQPSQDASSSTAEQGSDVVIEGDGEPWSTEEDRMLVELVLEKLKLTKSDWQDCARSLGKDRGSVGRRWKSLMINGDVGLKKGSSRRARIHGTWR